MKGKRGVSDVVATILVVLITVAAAGLLISFVLPFIQKSLNTGTECLKYKDYLKFAPDLKYTCYDATGLHGFSIRAATLGENAPNNTQQYKYHSIDYDKDWKISDEEFSRFMNLSGYRAGTTRTGEYHVDAANVSGYSPGPGNQPAGQEHSADQDKNWRFSGTELNRVIQLWNYGVAGVRTGDYHVQAGTEDGFEVGPAQVNAVGAGDNTYLKGFEVRLSNSQTSAKASVYSGNAVSSNVGGVRVLDRTITVIAAPRDGETQTYVYNAGGERYDTLEVYPVLQSDRICDKTDMIKISVCRGVNLA
jgi:flagellin-like protein